MEKFLNEALNDKNISNQTWFHKKLPVEAFSLIELSSEALGYGKAFESKAFE